MIANLKKSLSGVFLLKRLRENPLLKYELVKKISGFRW
jgi:hypothetical protein